MSEERIDVDIVLATYNGEKYLDEQIESLLSQTYKNWRLIIRDDGSIDNTLSVIKKYADKYSEKIIYVDDGKYNLGVIMNFLELIKHSTNSYTMFCDQDDVWLPNKIEITLNKIKSVEAISNVPIIVHTDLYVVDKNLNIIADSFSKQNYLKPEISKNLNKSLIENTVVGCTAIINKQLRDLVIKNHSQNIIMHDWWINLIACIFGKVEFINESTILYRQHEKNTVGSLIKEKTFLSKIKSLASSMKINKLYMDKTILQAKSLLENYGKDIDKKKYKIIQEFIIMPEKTFLLKLFTVIKYKFFRQKWIRNLFTFF